MENSLTVLLFFLFFFFEALLQVSASGRVADKLATSLFFLSWLNAALSHTHEKPRKPKAQCVTKVFL